MIRSAAQAGLRAALARAASTQLPHTFRNSVYEACGPPVYLLAVCKARSPLPCSLRPSTPVHPRSPDSVDHSESLPQTGIHAQTCMMHNCKSLALRDGSSAPRHLHSSQLPACISALATARLKHIPSVHTDPPAPRRLRIPSLHSRRRRTSSREGVHPHRAASAGGGLRPRPCRLRRPRPAPPVCPFFEGRPQRPRARPRRHGRHEQVPPLCQDAARTDRQDPAHPRQRHHLQLPLLRRPHHQVRSRRLPSACRTTRICCSPVVLCSALLSPLQSSRALSISRLSHISRGSHHRIVDLTPARRRTSPLRTHITPPPAAAPRQCVCS